MVDAEAEEVVGVEAGARSSAIARRSASSRAVGAHERRSSPVEEVEVRAVRQARAERRLRRPLVGLDGGRVGRLRRRAGHLQQERAVAVAHRRVRPVAGGDGAAEVADLAEHAAAAARRPGTCAAASTAPTSASTSVEPPAGADERHRVDRVLADRAASANGISPQASIAGGIDRPPPVEERPALVERAAPAAPHDRERAARAAPRAARASGGTFIITTADVSSAGASATHAD